MQPQENIQQLKKFALYAAKYWYVFAISLLLAISYGWYKNRYTPEVYSVSMSLYIKEDPGMDNSAAMLYGNSPLLKGNPNYYNEPYLLKADPLMEDVVRELGFYVAFYKEGRIQTTEIYPTPPVKFVPYQSGKLEELPIGSSYVFQFIDSTSFYLMPNQENIDPEAYRYRFGQRLQINGADFTAIYPINDKNHYSYFPDRYIVSFMSLKGIAQSYSGSLNTSWTAEGASLLDVSIATTIPEKGIDFLNNLAKTYQEQSVLERSANASNTILFIDQQLDEIRDSLTNIETRLENFKGKNNGGLLSSEAENILEQINELDNSRQQHLLKKKYYNYVTSYLSSEAVEEELLVIPASIGIDDPVLNSLIKQLVELQLQKKQIGRSTNVENPFYQEATIKIEDLKRSIRENIDNQQENLKNLVSNIDDRISQLNRKISFLPGLERQFVNIKRVYDLNENLYLYLLQKKAEAGITKASTPSSIRIVNPPKLMGGAISPNRKQNYIMSIMVGIGLPLVLLYLIFVFDDKIKDRDDLKSMTKISLLGAIGHSKGEGNLVVLDSPRSAVAESFRSLRSNLLFYLDNTVQGKGQVVLISSSISGEGKTFCSINLATVLAFNKNKTIILGADMRKPRIFEELKLDNDQGLSNYLSGQLPLEQAIQRTDNEYLDVIPGGIIPPNPSELLMGTRMEQMVQQLKENYDIIIIDSPPFGIVTDSMILHKFADHTIYVVRQGYTKTEHVKQMQEMFEQGKIAKVSILYNDMKVGRYGYGYGYADSYYVEKTDNGLFSKLFSSGNKHKKFK